MHKKAQMGVNLIVPLVIILVIAAVAGAYSLSTLDTVDNNFATGSAAALAISNATYAIGVVMTGLGIIGGVFLMIIIISALTSLGKTQ